MATGTLLGALRGYFGYMAAVQGVRSVFKDMGESVPPEIASAIDAVVAASRTDSTNLVAELNRVRSGMAPGICASVLEVALALVPRVYDETLAWPGIGGTTGFAKAGLGVAEVAVKAAFELGPWLKKAIGWIFAVGAGTVGAMVLYRVWQATDPMTGLARWFEMDTALQLRAESERQRCAGDKECEKAVDAKYRRAYAAFSNALLPDAAGECGLLDAPAGAMIGGLVGIGFGWAGMRRLMRG